MPTIPKRNFVPLRKPPRLSCEQHKLGVKKFKKPKKKKDKN